MTRYCLVAFITLDADLLRVIKQNTGYDFNAWNVVLTYVY